MGTICFMLNRKTVSDFEPSTPTQNSNNFLHSYPQHIRKEGKGGKK